MRILAVLLLFPILLNAAINDNLVYYRLNERSSNTFNDTSSTQNDAQKGAQLVLAQPGKLDVSVSFNGGNDSRIGFPSISGFIFYNTNFSVSMWVYPTTTGSKLGIVGGVDDAFGLCITSDNHVQATKINNTDLTQSTATVTQNQWNFVCFTFNNSTNTGTYYINSSSNTITYTGDFGATAHTTLIGQRYLYVDKFIGRIDEVGFWNREITSTEVSTIYNNGNGLTWPFNPESPNKKIYTYTTHQQKKIYKYGTHQEQKIYPYGTVTQPEIPPEEPGEGDTMNIVWAETFESLPNLLNATVKQYWQTNQSFWVDGGGNDIFLYNEGGSHGKVMQAYIREDHYAGGNDGGFACTIPMDTAYNEMYLSWDMYVDPLFDGESKSGYYSGKILFGFQGGNNVFNPSCWCPVGSNTNGVDSTINGHGWCNNGVWGSGNTWRPYAYDQNHDGSNGQIELGFGTKGQWVHVTTRIKLNTPGQRDGLIEFFVNDSLWDVSYVRGMDLRGLGIPTRDTLKQNSWQQWNAGLGRVSGIFLTFFSGGGGIHYASKRDNYLKIDNLIAYHYNSNANAYRSGFSEHHRKIPTVRPTAIKYSRDILNDSIYVGNHGRINCTKWGQTIPAALNTADSCTKYVNMTTSTFSYKINFWNDGWNYNDSGSELDSWVKIYYWNGTKWVRSKWFQEGGEHDGVPTYNVAYDLFPTVRSGYEVMITYFSGNDSSYGWILDY
jgi:hypothetical protein